MPDPIAISRRRFGSIVGAALASAASGAACRMRGSTPADDGRLTARPRPNATTTATGRTALGLASRRDAILQLPSKAPAGPLALAVLFHGAGGSAEGILRRLGSFADEAGVAVLAPDSRGSSWDAILGGFGPDVAFFDRALARVFETVAVDPARLAVGGFSDGATYAVSLGLINGDLFRRILAFSPGFVVDGPVHGRPRIFVSHGTGDEILPIDRCGRPIASALRRSGYDVTYREFDGGHEIPADIARDALRWAADS